MEGTPLSMTTKHIHLLTQISSVPAGEKVLYMSWRRECKMEGATRSSG